MTYNENSSSNRISKLFAKKIKQFQGNIVYILAKDAITERKF